MMLQLPEGKARESTSDRRQQLGQLLEPRDLGPANSYFRACCQNEPPDCF